jgi:DNA-directed RNA polymerase subunit RPC12/RpoP
MNSTASIFTPATVVIMANGREAQIRRDNVEFNAVVAALDAGDYDAAFAAFDKAEAIRKQSKGGFQVSNGVVSRNGMPVHNVVTSRILEFVDAKLPFTPLFAFLEKLNDNPSQRAVNELYPFLEHRNLPITPDGDFLAYKSIGSDWFSKASGSEDVEVSEDGGVTWTVYRGRIPNKVGNIVRMKRNLVDNVADRTCSMGLHVGALEYAGPNGTYNSGGDHVVIVRVNPRDAVSVPTDHDAQKLRVCEYEVVGEFVKALESPLVEEDATEVKSNKGSVEKVSFRCRKCRGRKKASTFSGAKGQRQKCPRCGSKRVFKL